MELHQSIKFRCANCGLRFIRNEKLKAHLDQHFHDNNEIRNRQRITPCQGHKTRPLFNTFNSWVTGAQPSMPGAAGNKAGGDKNLIAENQNIVPYSSVDNACFMCKEKFKVIRDQGQTSLAQNGNQGEEANTTTDENSYFVNVRKIRVSLRNKQTG